VPLLGSKSCWKEKRPGTKKPRGNGDRVTDNQKNTITTVLASIEGTQKKKMTEKKNIKCWSRGSGFGGHRLPSPYSISRACAQVREAKKATSKGSFKEFHRRGLKDEGPIERKGSPHPEG